MYNYFVFDLETTHLETFKARILQMSFMFKGVQKTFLINPTIEIPQSSSNIHNIYYNDIKNAPKFSELAPKLFKLLNECDAYMTYNGDSFDLNILSHELLRCGLHLPNKVSIDVYKMVQMHEGSKKLKDVYRRYTGEELIGAHDAGADVAGTIKIYEYLTKNNQPK